MINVNLEVKLIGFGFTLETRWAWLRVLSKIFQYLLLNVNEAFTKPFPYFPFLSETHKIANRNILRIKNSPHSVKKTKNKKPVKCKRVED